MRITEPADLLSVIIDLAQPPHALSFPQDALRKIAAQRLYKAVHNDGAPRCSEFLEALRDFRHTCQRTGEHQNAVRVVDILTKPGAFFRPLDTELLKTFENWVYETFPHQSRREWAAGRIVRLALAMRGWEASNIVDQSFRTATLRDVMAEIAMRGIPGAIAACAAVCLGPPPSESRSFRPTVRTARNCSSRPIWRCTKPSARAATGWCRYRPYEVSRFIQQPLRWLRRPR